MLSEHTLEIRFQPNPNMLDNRGAWAAIISKETALPEWKIVENRVDFRTSDNAQRAFLSFRNFGITIQDQTTPNYFVDKANKLVRTIMKLHGFDSQMPVVRLGVRAKICQPYDGDFADIADEFRSTFFQAAPLDRLGGSDNVVDAGVLLYFKTQLGQINANIGATDLAQLKKLFPHHKDHPEASWTSDMDYFIEVPKIMAEKDVIRTITALAAELGDRYNAVSDLIKL